MPTSSSIRLKSRSPHAEAPPPRNVQMKNTTASAISAALKARAFVFRTKPMTPAASTATPTAKGSHVGYWPTLSEKNPLITAPRARW